VSNDGPLGQPRGIGFGILMFIITFSIYSVYWAFKTFEELQQHTGTGVGGVMGLVIQLVVSPVNLFLAPSEIGKMYQADGQESPVSGMTGLWNLLPLIGSIVWWVKVQGALNRYWESKAAGSSMPAATPAV
jgi:Domain of unknown function (DUF4234)